jgi:hypothetical protein
VPEARDPVSAPAHAITRRAVPAPDGRRADLVLALPWIAAREGRIDGPAPESRQFLTGSMALIDTCQSIASTSGAFAFELDRPPTLIA